MSEIARQTFKNAVQPIHVWDGGDQRAFASAENILFEAFISYMARWAVGKERRGFFDLVFVHALAEPLLGASESITGGKTLDLKGAYSEAFLSGLRQTPSVFVADYAKNTFGAGFHVPKPSIAEILFTTGAKIASRPIMKLIYENGPEAHTLPGTQDKIVNKQMQAFNANWQ